MTKLLLIFIALNFANVVLQTIKSLCTVNAGKWLASIINAVAYGFYTVIVVYTLCDLPLLHKVLIVGLCNFIGVFAVKYIEEKRRPEKLWKVEMALPYSEISAVRLLTQHNIPHNYQRLNEYIIFNCYCANSGQTQIVKDICRMHGGKISAYESKAL